jgi:hypothetical protein
VSVWEETFILHFERFLVVHWAHTKEMHLCGVFGHGFSVNRSLEMGSDINDMNLNPISPLKSIVMCVGLLMLRNLKSIRVMLSVVPIRKV